MNAAQRRKLLTKATKSAREGAYSSLPDLSSLRNAILADCLANRMQSYLTLLKIELLESLRHVAAGNLRAAYEVLLVLPDHRPRYAERERLTGLVKLNRALVGALRGLSSHEVLADARAAIARLGPGRWRARARLLVLEHAILSPAETRQIAASLLVELHLAPDADLRSLANYYARGTQTQVVLGAAHMYHFND